MHASLTISSSVAFIVSPQAVKGFCESQLQGRAALQRSQLQLPPSWMLAFHHLFTHLALVFWFFIKELEQQWYIPLPVAVRLVSSRFDLMDTKKKKKNADCSKTNLAAQKLIKY